MTLGEMLHTQALRDPEATALICEDEAISYGELDESSSLLAGWLLQQGLRRGDLVAIHWCNSIEAAQVFFAAFKAGVILVPISLLLKPPEVAWILDHSQPAICLCQPSLAPKVLQGSDSFCRVLTALPELKSLCASVPPAVAEDEPAVLLYTSGSTSKPKGAIHTHRTLAEVTRLFVEYMLDANDVLLTMTAMMHATGLGFFLSAIRLGRPAVLLPAFDPASALDTIERLRCTCTLGLPALLQFVVEEQVRSPRDTRALRVVFGAGDRVPADLQERFAAVFGVPLREGFGMSETFPVCVNSSDEARPGSMGRPLPGVEVRIVDDADRDVPGGMTGEMVVRGAANCIGIGRIGVQRRHCYAAVGYTPGIWYPVIARAICGSRDVGRRSSFTEGGMSLHRRWKRCFITTPESSRQVSLGHPIRCMGNKSSRSSRYGKVQHLAKRNCGNTCELGSPTTKYRRESSALPNCRRTRQERFTAFP